MLVTLESVSGLGWAGWAGLGWGGWEPSRQAAAGVLQLTFHCSLIPVLSTHHTALSPDIKCADFLEVEFSGALITVGSVLLGWWLLHDAML